MHMGSHCSSISLFMTECPRLTAALTSIFPFWGGTHRKERRKFEEWVMKRVERCEDILHTTSLENLELGQAPLLFLQVRCKLVDLARQNGQLTEAGSLPTELRLQGAGECLDHIRLYKRVSSQLFH